MSMKKMIVTGLILVILSTLLFANGGTEGFSSVPKEEKVTLTFGYAGGDPLVKQLTADGVANFMEANPSINIIQMPSGSGAYLEFLKTKDAVGEFPDMLDSRDTEVWVDADKLAELPESVLKLTKQAPVLNGKHYVSPISVMPAAGGTYYNKKLFDELGLEEPKTYQEFLNNCEIIKDSGVAPLVVGGKDGWHMGFTWGHFWLKNIASENPDWIADRYRNKVSFSDDNMKANFKQYGELWERGYVEKGFLSTGDNQIASFLVTGKAAMFISGTWMIQQIMDADREFEFRWAPIPDEEGNLQLMYGPNLQGWALSKEAGGDPKKVAAFEAFMEYFYSPENYVPYLQKTNMFSAAAAPMDVQYPSDVIMDVSAAMEKASFNDINWNSHWGENRLPGSFRNFAYKALQEYLIGETTLDEFTAKLDAEWEVEASQFNPTK